MVPCKSTAEEVSFEWSHHRILFTDSKVRTTLHVSILTFGVKGLISLIYFNINLSIVELLITLFQYYFSILNSCWFLGKLWGKATIENL